MNCEQSMTHAVFSLLIRCRVVVLLMAAAWAAAGVWVALHTPMDAVPDLSDNQVLVYADWPGHQPPDVEQHVTRPLSLELEGLPGVRALRGSSEVGFSLVHLLFDDAVPFSDARRRVSERLERRQSQLPEGVTPRLAADGIPTGQIFWYTVEGGGLDLAELRRLQDTTVAPPLRSIPGVAEVASVGGFVSEVHVEAHLDRLAEAGIPLSQLEQSLRHVAGTFRPTNDVRNDFPLNGTPNASATLADLKSAVLSSVDGRTVRLEEVARVAIGAAPRRGVFEKDGNEAVAGIVHLRYGHNPLEVTRAVRRKLQEVEDGLPAGVRLVACYDRTPLIAGAVGTVTRTLIESLLVTSLCVILVLRHWRTSLVITLTLPLAVLGTFLGMGALRLLGVADVQTNIMSLAGIVVSIGVLVDSSIVVAENVTHQLRKRFGDRPVTGDVSDVVAGTCTTVAVPACCAVLIMVVSFLPVFALEGIDGRMYRPLAWTKTLALLSVAALTVTLVPVLCATFIRGRVRDESESVLVRSVIGVYRPVLAYLMDHPLPLVFVLCATVIIAAAATGVDLLVRLMTALGAAAVWWLARRWSRVFLAATMILVALAAQSAMRPIGLALRLPLDEGMVMDMPISVPGITVTQALDDLKARNMVLCRFPEVQMVTGKAGRAETPFDPAPLDMIETMVEFRPSDRWPSRRLLRSTAEHQAAAVVKAIVAARLVEEATVPEVLVSEIVDAGLPRFDAIQREVAWQRTQSFQVELSHRLAQRLVRELARQLRLRETEVQGLASSLPTADARRLAQQLDIGTVHSAIVELQKLLRARDVSVAVAETRLLAVLQAEASRAWSSHVALLNAELRRRAPATWTQIVLSELFARQAILDDGLAETWRQVLAARYGAGQPVTHHGGGHDGMSSLSKLPMIDPHPEFDALVQRLTAEFAPRVWLWPHDSESITRPGGEMDAAVQMPGWANVWTRPIQNRVDMLATGVNSEVGVRVMGRDFNAVVQTSENLADVLRTVPGAADVIADPVRGKAVTEIHPDPQRMASHGVSDEVLKDILRLVNGGRVIGRWHVGSTTLPVRLTASGISHRIDETSLQMAIPQQPVSTSQASDAAASREKPLPQTRLGDVAHLRRTEGPATVKSENGWLRNYVRLNVRGRDPAEFVAAAQQVVKQSLVLPDGVFLEWTGQFEHAARTRAAMLWMTPVVVLLILVILYATYRDLADAGLMLLAVPGALAGGVLCQWLLGFPFSVAVGVGYIACFGMAAATSMVMLVYLREAVENAGGLERMSLDDLRNAVLSGAVHRLRPKLLTEATTILSLAPMLWSTGAGADVIRPMAAPVLGGILIADEVVDLLLPVAFFAVRRRRLARRELHRPMSLTSKDQE